MSKRFLALLAAVLLAASLSACGGVLVDLDTPKSEELSAQYDFYPDSMNTIRSDMGITPEQADEVFIILASCSLNEKVTSISESDGVYTVYFGGNSLDVTLSDGVIETVYSGQDMLYPEAVKHIPFTPSQTRVQSPVKMPANTSTIPLIAVSAPDTTP